uniref:Uncharacterized protein n=1 Tax=Arundo donax TaxID=35708 RepID=A0A0A8ZDH9_ARUDO
MAILAKSLMPATARVNINDLIKSLLGPLSDGTSTKFSSHTFDVILNITARACSARCANMLTNGGVTKLLELLQMGSSPWTKSVEVFEIFQKVLVAPLSMSLFQG